MDAIEFHQKVTTLCNLCNDSCFGCKYFDTVLFPLREAIIVKYQLPENECAIRSINLFAKLRDIVYSWDKKGDTNETDSICDKE
jgi:hypothetical protein